MTLSQAYLNINLPIDHQKVLHRSQQVA